ncbi:hypothetical protein TrST_g13721 [Triparma strigata]|uniref:Alpha-glucosidase n=1 Tax=Triparma strigata TaxID=1606541 RepID=A0A9W7BS83_9STRA|nr:hypothetical protein TrST_g13721 [Triparma strigata]
MLRILIALLLTSTTTALSTYELPPFTITVDESGSSNAPFLGVAHTASDTPILSSLTTVSASRAADASSLRGSSVLPFLALGTSKVTKGPIEETQYVMKEKEKWWSRTDALAIDSTSATDDQVIISGTVFRASSQDSTSTAFTITFSAAAPNPTDPESGASLNFDVTLADGGGNRAYLNLASPSSEKIFGHGVQYSSVNHKDKTVPIIISEQGIGRGLQPITGFLNTFVGGSGGSWHTTYGCKPIFMTDMNRGLMLTNTETTIFDYTSESAEAVEIEVWGYPISGTLYYYAESPMAFTEMLTEYTGRMSALPEWTQEGAIIGLEGGSDIVEEKMASLMAADIPIKGLWLQDWAGLHHSYDGDRLQWNWRLSNDQYPRWSSMKSTMEDAGIKMLTYINPYFQINLDDDDEVAESQFTQGDKSGYFIKDNNNETYVFKSGSIKFGCLDVTNPAAREWMKFIIKENLIGEASSFGWMSDFGEAVPYDAILYSGVSGADHHNEFPEYWQQVNREAIEEIGMQDEIMFFSRSAFNKSPSQARVFWLGDQLTTFDDKDGLGTVLISAQSSGLTGNTLTHSDIGGYTVVDYPLAHYHRSEELLKRWIEVEAFSGSMFRTHVGSSFEDSDFQIWDTDESMAFFGKFASIFAYLKDYRQSLFVEAAEKGHPLVRSMFLEFPTDQNAWDENLLKVQFMFGRDFLVAPVIIEGDVTKSVHFPEFDGCSNWVSVWSEDTYECGSTVEVDADLGKTPVFYKAGCEIGAGLKAFLASK